MAEAYFPRGLPPSSGEPLPSAAPPVAEAALPSGSPPNGVAAAKPRLGIPSLPASKRGRNEDLPPLGRLPQQRQGDEVEPPSQQRQREVGPGNDPGGGPAGSKSRGGVAVPPTEGNTCRLSLQGALDDLNRIHPFQKVTSKKKRLQPENPVIIPLPSAASAGLDGQQPSNMHEVDAEELVEAAKASLEGHQEDGPPLGIVFDEPKAKPAADETSHAVAKRKKKVARISSSPKSAN